MEEKIPVEEYAQKYGFKTSAILYNIRAGILDGVHEDGKWYVIRGTRPGRGVIASRSKRPQISHPQSESIKIILRRWLAPRYDEVTLFIMGIASVLLLMVDAQLRSTISSIIFEIRDVRLLIILALFLGGLFFSIYHAFVEQEKTEMERAGMLFFAVLLQSMIGMITGFYLLEHSSQETPWIFPIWNVLNGILLASLYRFNVIDVSCIVDNDASRLQVLLATVVTYALILVGHHLLNFHWAITLSMTIALASTVSRGVDQVVLLWERRKE